MPLLDAMIAAVEPWSTFYGNSTTVSIAVTAMHLGAMMVGGGFAIAADRLVLKKDFPADVVRRRVVADSVGDAHKPVLIALGISALTGVLQLTADLEALATNKALWVKAGLLLALCVNGLLMLRNERSLRRDPANGAAFGSLRVRAISSAVLWFAIVLAGVVLQQG
jgi:uncharacterized membrane protein